MNNLDITDYIKEYKQEFMKEADNYAETNKKIGK